ncbi:MAG: hypothetical protein JXA57_06295 [Armatimonadetes bacterium]|nr:hypothetical protein [Armatimonadota bacterium]
MRIRQVIGVLLVVVGIVAVVLREPAGFTQVGGMLSFTMGFVSGAFFAAGIGVLLVTGRPAAKP